MYATAGTAAKLWASERSESRRRQPQHTSLQKTVNEPLPKNTAEKLKETFSLPDEFFNSNRLVTEQDKALYSLCRPKDCSNWPEIHPVRRRHKRSPDTSSILVIKSTLQRVKQFETECPQRRYYLANPGFRQVLTMVLLARNLALDPDCLTLNRSVTDRDDLDRQLAIPLRPAVSPAGPLQAGICSSWLPKKPASLPP